ncbi:NUDIX hydrolase [Corynebacterium timonense]|nr:NUDIX hydrolase [Corynebacterium timonense]
MSDTTRPSSGDSTSPQGEGPRRRGRRRRGSRPAGKGQRSHEKTNRGEAAKKRKKNSSRRGRTGRGRASAPAQRRPPQHDSAMETRDETSAGGLVVSGMAEAVGPGGNVDLSRIYVALIGRLDKRGRLLWSMPKGHVEDGEHQWTTAEREVWEETGISGEAFDTLGVIDYWFVSDGVRIHKTVHHNLLRYVDGVLNDDDPEVTEVAWVPMSELIERLAYADERKLARIAHDRMPALARKEAKAGRATPR